MRCGLSTNSLCWHKICQKSELFHSRIQFDVTVSWCQYKTCFLDPHNFLPEFLDDAQMHKFRKVTKFQFTKSGLPCSAHQLFLLPKRLLQSDIKEMLLNSMKQSYTNSLVVHNYKTRIFKASQTWISTNICYCRNTSPGIRTRPSPMWTPCKLSNTVSRWSAFSQFHIPCIAMSSVKSSYLSGFLSFDQ